MKNRLKILLILPMFLVSCFLGINVPRNVSAANISQNGDFEAFSNQVVNMIRKYDDNNYEEIVFTINDDLYEQNNTLMVSVDTFADLTGAVVERFGDSLTITSSTKSIELQEDEEIVTVSDNSVIYMQQPLTRINEDFSISFEDISTILGYEIFEKEDEIVLSRPFESKRIILKSSKPIDDKGAIASASGYNDFYIYQYSSEQNAVNAYDYFKTLDCVEWVEPDAIYTTCDIEEGKALPQGLQDDYSYSSWGADAMGIESYSNYLIDTVGKNNLNEVIVAVIDTGIDTDHEWFEDRILLDLGKNYSSSVSSSAYDFEDVYGHGTHCAGIVCDLTLDNVKILPIKVMNDQGYGYASQIMLGINYVTSLKNSYNIVAMNLSLGSANGIGSEEYNSYSTALNNAYANGIMPVVAAGNDGADVTNHTPANIECAITVAAIGESAGLYYRTSWSNYGSFVDVCAPGHHILSACVGGGTVLMSGTSMAAPHIAGTIGLLMSDSNKTYTLRDIENLLDVNVIDLGDDGWDSFYGEGLVNLEYAYAELMNNVTFSHTQTDCTETFNLTLTSSQAGAKIYYTTDGSTPTLDNGTLYSSPILVNKTQRIKARAYVVSSGVVTKYTKVSQMTYCFYGQDVEGAFVVSADGVLTSYAGVLTEVTVPKEVDGITITSIGQNAFTSSSVISVTLPSSVTTIGDYAFNGCSTVQTVYGPNVKVIDMYAFNGCKNMRYVTDEYFPELTTIGKYSFFQCYNLRPISLSKVTKVDYWAFGMKNVTPTYLTSVSLPSATIIAEGAFIFCQYLTDINIPSAEIIASGAFRECDIINLSLPSAKYIGNNSFYVNENLLSANMPEVEVIGASSFYKFCTKLSNVYIPNVRIICDTAFRECTSITALDMPNVERISDWAFYDCDKLATINTPNLKYIGYVAFGSCDKLTVVNLPNAISIGKGAFRLISGLTKVTLSSCLEVIGDNSFSSASKTTCVFEIYAGTAGEDFVVNNGYNYIDLSTNNSIFSYYVVSKEVYITGLNETPTENIIIPSYINDMPVVKICSEAFKNCEYITSLNVAYLREIGNNAFEGCVNLEKVNLSRIETVGNNAFLNCISLNEVNIQNVKNVGDRAFYGCSSLLEIRFGQNISFVGTKAFGYSYEEMLIPTFVIYGYSDTYAEIYAENENIEFRAIFNELTHYYYKTYVNPENGQTEILISFVDSFTTGNLIIPSSYNGMTISKIGDQAFYNCSFITGIILPETVTTIGIQSFYGCTLLESINLDHVTKIGSHSFWQCASLKELNAPLLEAIPTYAFEGCSSMTIANIPNVKSIGETAFNQCYLLKEVVSPKLEVIQFGAFGYDYQLEKIDTRSLKVLGTETGNLHNNGQLVITSQIFVYCTSLKYLYLPNIEAIGDATFSASSVEYVVIGNKFNRYFNGAINSSVDIYGYAGSFAEAYANEKGNTFITLDNFDITNNLENSTSTTINANKTLSITTTGFGQEYQWYKSSSNSTANGLALKNENARTLPIDTTYAGTSYYYVVVTNWDGEVLISNICAVTIIGDDNMFNISVISTENGTISPNGNVSVAEGQNKTFTFTPNVGYHVKSILIDGVALTGMDLENAIQHGYTFTNINNSHTISAIFEINSYTITVIQADNGRISSAEGSYTFGASATFTITPNTGYIISKLIIDGEDYITADMSTYTFSNISANHTITALFTARTNMAYKVNHFVESLTSDGAIYYGGKYYIIKETETLYGATNTLTSAEPKTYIGFNNLVFNQLNISSNGTTQVNIYYNRNTYTITIVEGTGIASTVGGGTYRYEEYVTITAVENIAYNWINWTSNNATLFPTNSNKQVSFNMPNENLTLTANAQMKTFVITTTAGANGSITPANVTISYGENQKFDFVPNAGYKVKKVLIDGIDMGNIDTYTLINVVATHTIYVTFEQCTLTVTFNPNGGALISGSLTQTINYGGTATAPTLLREGYTQNGWDKALNNITSNITITARWNPIVYTISYNLDGGTNNPDNPNSYTIETETITLKNPTKEGFNFAGWYEYSNFTGNTVISINKGSTENISLYAKFVAKECSVVFDLGSSRFGNITCIEGDLDNLEYGDTLTFEITVDNGYEVDKVLVNGVETDVVNNKFIVSSITENTNIQVTYKQSSSVITPPADDNNDNPATKDNDITKYNMYGGIGLIVALLITLIVVTAKNNKNKKKLIAISNNQTPQSTHSYSQNSMQNQQELPRFDFDNSQNDLLNKALEFVKGRDSHFIGFCTRYNIDYKNDYNNAVIRYYQAYLRSIKPKEDKQ